jgi:hypothetical protein
VEAGTPDALRRTRAVAVLERVGSPAAVGLLTKLAAGPPGGRTTRQAREALARLRRAGE